MRTQNEKLTEELRKIDPLASGHPADTHLPDEGLLRRILATDLREQAPQKVSRRRILAPAAVAVMATLALLVALRGGTGGGENPLEPLTRVALAAASQAPSAKVSTLFSKTRFISMDTTVAGGESWSVFSSKLREEWRSESGPGRLREVAAAPQFVGPGDRAAWEAAGSPNFLTVDSEQTTERALPPASEVTEKEDLSSLPAEPEALFAELSQRTAQVDNSASPPVRTLLLIAELLQDPAATPSLRGALYRAAEEIPGIEYFGSTEDKLGRPGVAIGLESDYSGGRTRYELIFDPRSSEVLATASIGLAPVQFADVSPPFTLQTTLFLESRP